MEGKGGGTGWSRLASRHSIPLSVSQQDAAAAVAANTGPST